MKKRHERWHPPSGTSHDARAIQALALYAQQADIPSKEEIPAPSPSEAKRALDWIINVAAGTYEEPFLEGKADATNYLLGRRSVGLAIIKLMKVKPEILDE